MTLDNLWVIPLMLPPVAIIAPIVEEIVFRGVLYRLLAVRIGVPVAIVVSGLLFGAIHFNAMGFIPLSALGMYFAYLYQQTGSLWVPIAVHALFNASQMGLIFLLA